MEYDNSNRGALFKNRKDNPNWPDYKGSLNVAGTDYWLSAWLKKDKSGNTYMSLSVKPKEQKPEDAPAPKPATVQAEQSFDDDIPFAWAYAIPVAGLLAGAMYAQDMLQMWA